MEELAALNARIVHQLPFEAVADRLPAGMSAEAWEAIRPNLQKVDDAAGWWDVVEGPVSGQTAEEDRPFLAAAVAAAEALDWSENPWGALTAALKERTGRSGKSLFLPLRRALTGRDSGPEMAPLMKLIGKDKALERLREAAER
jgi:glutamyl-tRNA synthetase